MHTEMLEVFREVARRRSITAAATTLRYTQSAVSQQMAQLEREAGAQLVVRSSRGVPVRMDWRVAGSRRERLQRWEQDLAGTPFARVLKASAVEIRLEPADEGCRITVAVERELENRGLIAGWFGRRASRRHAGDALARLSRLANASARPV